MTRTVNFSVQVLYTVDHRKQRSLASVCTGVDKGGPGGQAFPMAGQKKNLFVKIEGLSSFTWSVMWSQKEMEGQGRGAPPPIHIRGYATVCVSKSVKYFTK